MYWGAGIWSLGIEYLMMVWLSIDCSKSNNNPTTENDEKSHATICSMATKRTFTQ